MKQICLNCSKPSAKNSSFCSDECEFQYNPNEK